MPLNQLQIKILFFCYPTLLSNAKFENIPRQHKHFYIFNWYLHKQVFQITIIFPRQHKHLYKLFAHKCISDRYYLRTYIKMKKIL